MFIPLPTQAIRVVSEEENQSQTVPVREVFINRILKKYSMFTKDVVEVMIDAKNYYELTQEDNPITQESITAVSRFLRTRYNNVEKQAIEEVKEYNIKVKRTNL